MAGALAAILPDGRLHLQDGPIDLVIGLEGTRAAIGEAASRANAAFQGLLAGLVAELPLLRAPLGPDRLVMHGPVARRMAAAVWPFRADFITPMAAVAGAVAEEVLAALAKTTGLTTAYVNNGGDIALFLAPGAMLRVGVVPHLAQAAPEALIRIGAMDPVRGIATSGWPGRSFSLGIADAVTVLARSAAEADAAATVIANAVDAEHPAIRRAPASSLDPDSDLGDRLVTTGVDPLPAEVAEAALDAGEARAEALLSAGLIEAAALVLGDAVRVVGSAGLLAIPTDTVP
ncbi:UPF0280 family protein [Belnapia rosea]|uniref:Uncharacterized protein n=1 Tax=Belnapia rosea TaxID=938405 RepID=A0A1G6KYT1_9PROT|nr:UPF0280 family protein [Belnapia rosea]SDB70679.1 hypothetical protein SAMN02927895_03839 [Belnapia rosea]SDC36262.1 hypothetical protein SAMN04487779_1001700 [Belnapia rosea]